METEGLVPLHLLLATSAKVLCSAIFVSGRDEAEAIRNSAFHALQSHHLPEVLLPLASVETDRRAGQVTVRVRLDAATARRIVAGYRDHYPGLPGDWQAETERLIRLGTVARTARHLGDQGCAILRRGDDRLFFTPAPVRSMLADARTTPWPMGDADAPGQGSSGIGQAVADALADPDACTAAVVVVHRGRVVAEGYAPGIGRDTQLESWSMGKSLTATLVGRLVADGRLSLDQPAPVPAWQHPDDPRRTITIRDLLQMSSGLRMSGHNDPRGDWPGVVPEHFYVYMEAVDTFDFAISRPPEFPPQTIGRYRNCDPLTLGYIVKRIVQHAGQDYLGWPQAVLFDRIGIRRQVLDTDIFGNFVLSGLDYGTARNWARLGLLYLWDGVWDGARLLPEGWSKFVGTPAPAWPQPIYGGQFWLNRTGEFDLPRDAYMMAGSGQQRVFIVPSADLVVVRLGHVRGHDRAAPSINAMLRSIMGCLAAGASTPRTMQ